VAGPVVDVGMPAHGRPVFLAEAIRSVLEQSHRELRLVVLDDSQDDAIERVVRPFLEDSRVEYRHEPPMSATRAMTELIQSGSAPYFAFLHDDDRWGQGFLERRVEFLEAHPDCGFVFSGHIDIDDEGRETARAKAPFPEGEVAREKLVSQLLERAVVDVMHSVLTRRSALDEAGPYLEEGVPRLFDWELWLRLALTGPAGCLEVEDAHYRAHDEQMSGAPGRARDFADLARRADALVLERAPELRLSEPARRRQLARLELSAALDLLDEDRPADAREALRAALHVDRGTALRDKRLPATLAALAAGRPGRRALSKLRAAAYRRAQRLRRRVRR
jgi:glycosyltransferase involved in cell wall biosynthesis